MDKYIASGPSLILYCQPYPLSPPHPPKASRHCSGHYLGPPWKSPSFYFYTYINICVIYVFRGRVQSRFNSHYSGGQLSLRGVIQGSCTSPIAIHQHWTIITFSGCSLCDVIWKGWDLETHFANVQLKLNATENCRPSSFIGSCPGTEACCTQRDCSSDCPIFIKTWLQRSVRSEVSVFECFFLLSSYYQAIMLLAVWQCNSLWYDMTRFGMIPNCCEMIPTYCGMISTHCRMMPTYCCCCGSCHSVITFNLLIFVLHF